MYEGSSNPVPNAGVDIRLYGENGYVSPVQRVQETDPLNTHYIFNGPVATKDSVWRLNVDKSNAIQGTKRYLTWQIGAYDSSSNLIPGRVFTYDYRLSQRDWQIFGYDGSVDISLYTITKDGYAYRLNYDGYMGIDSSLHANSLGKADVNCNPMYRSYSAAQWIEPNPQPQSGSSCDSDPYPIFFENPLAAGLPESAEFDDGQTKRILPTIKNIAINNLKYTHTPGSITMDGTITADIENYAGSVNIQIDANGNGDFTDPIDRTILTTPDISGHVQASFDGLDGNGNAIPAYSKLAVKLMTDKPGEVHFIRTDIEKSAGGIEVIALNGSQTGPADLYWDDTVMTTERCGTRNIDPVQNLSGVNSAGGVHSWDYDGCVNPDGTNSAGNNQTDIDTAKLGSSWGNTRYIDDWTYRSSSTQATTDTGPAPELHITKVANKTKVSDGSEVKYTIKVTNKGSATVPHIIDKLPKQLSAINSKLPSDCQPKANNTIECTPNYSLEPNQTLTYDIYTKVSAKDSKGQLTNTAHVYGHGDPACTDDKSTTDRCHSDANVNMGRLADTGGNIAMTYLLALLLVLAGYGLRHRVAHSRT